MKELIENTLRIIIGTSVILQESVKDVHMTAFRSSSVRMPVNGSAAAAATSASSSQQLES